MKSLLITAGVFFGMCVIYILIMLSQTEHNFTYILDDAYIHLAMAKNFSLHGVWGVTEYDFSSSSSSPVFTFVLSGLITVFGNQQLIPLVFNLICAGLILYFLNRYYSDQFEENAAIVFASVFTLLFTSVHLLVFSGMEHVLQLLVMVINIYYFEKWKLSGFRNYIFSGWFFFTITMLGLIRFESMFYFLAIAFVFLLLRQYKNSAYVLLYGFIPVMIFGYFNYQKAGYFFPNSVIIKGTRLDFSGDYPGQIMDVLLSKIILNPYFYFAGLFPLCLSVLLIIQDYKKKLNLRQVVLNNFLLITFGITFFIYGLFGQFTNFFRYEAFLLTIFVMAAIPKIKKLFINGNFLLKQNRQSAFLITSITMTLILKIALVCILIIIGSRNVYEQQVQSARFLKKYYNNNALVANDIGAVCYFTNIHLLDIMGLGSKEVVPFKIKAGQNERFRNFLMDSTAQHDFKLAILYDEWTEGRIPENWKKVAMLEITGVNAVLGSKQVFVYAVDPDIHESLKQNIKDFSWNSHVKVKISE